MKGVVHLKPFYRHLWAYVKEDHYLISELNLQKCETKWKQTIVQFQSWNNKNVKQSETNHCPFQSWTN